MVDIRLLKPRRWPQPLVHKAIVGLQHWRSLLARHCEVVSIRQKGAPLCSRTSGARRRICFLSTTGGPQLAVSHAIQNVLDGEHGRLNYKFPKLGIFLLEHTDVCFRDVTPQSGQIQVKTSGVGTWLRGGRGARHSSLFGQSKARLPPFLSQRGARRWHARRNCWKNTAATNDESRNVHQHQDRQERWRGGSPQCSHTSGVGAIVLQNSSGLCG